MLFSTLNAKKSKTTVKTTLAGTGFVPVRNPEGNDDKHKTYKHSQNDITNKKIAMTAFELNAAVYPEFQAISGNKDYMRQVLDLIKKLTKRSKTTVINNTKKIRVDLNRPSSLDEFVGMASPDSEDDDHAKEQYFKEKYGEYL